jgi:UDP-N-acetylmuramoylalanine--D-glutamate ligase
METMIDLSSFAGETVAVLGLGRSGLATARALVEGGARVWAWDDAETVRSGAGRNGIPIVDLGGCDWRQPAALVISPGIPHTHPQPHPAVGPARVAGCPIIGDVDLLARTQRTAAYLGITGTNGKSTTTALIGHILRASGADVEMGANLGEPVMDMRPLGADGFYVLEMSSYQLELVPSARFDVAVLLNVSADHLDRHGGMDGYLAAKKRIFQGQGEGHTAVVGVDDDLSRALVDELRVEGTRRVIPVSSARHCPGGVFVDCGRLMDDMDGNGMAVLDLTEIATLPGIHNHQNAAAAYAVARAVGVPIKAIVAAMRSYPGLAHRQELVARLDGVAYVNDSKATNADAAAKALACYDAIYWIAGGLPKEGGLAGLEPYYDRLRHAFLIGEAAEAFAAELGDAVAWTISGTLETAVRQARGMATDGSVVLLSPACASFDQFANFEVRGDAFRALVESGGATS